MTADTSGLPRPVIDALARGEQRRARAILRLPEGQDLPSVYELQSELERLLADCGLYDYRRVMQRVIGIPQPHIPNLPISVLAEAIVELRSAAAARAAKGEGR